MSFKKIICAIVVASFVSGCATSARIEANKDIEKNKSIASQKSKAIINQGVKIAGIQDSKRFWVSATSVKYENKKLINKSWISKAPVTFNLGKLDIRDAINAIKVAYPKLNVSINDDVFSKVSFDSADISDPNQSTSGSSNESYDTEVRMLYKGTLSGLFDKISSDIDVSWSIDSDNKINIYRFETKMFKLNLISGTSDSSSGMTSGATSSSSTSSSSSSNSVSSGGASMSTTFAAKTDPFNEVVENMRAILSNKGKIISMSGLGTVTVTDTPKHLKEISALVDEFNKSLTSQIVVSVKVYSIKKTNSDSYGLDWNLFYSSIKNKFNIALATVPPTNVGAGILTATITNTNSPWSGTQSIVNALSSLGDVSIVTETKAVTVDNIAIPISQSKSVSYISEATPQTTDSNGTTIPGSITPATVSTGFNMLVTPKIISNGQVMMQFAIDMSELTSLVTRTTAGISVQSPEVSRNTFLQRAIIKSGQTLIMTGFNKKTSTSNSSGLGNSSNWLLGGNKKASVVNEYLVLVVSPRIVEGAN